MKVKAYLLWHQLRMHYYRSIIRARLDGMNCSHKYQYSINPNYRIAYDKFEESRKVLRQAGLVLT